MGTFVEVTMEVGYWKIRGLGAPLRMMCAFKETEVTHYAANSGEMWFGGKKPELQAKNSMTNLPFIVDGDQVITQSNSCMLYLGQKLGIDTPENFIKNHQALDQIMDLRNDVITIVYPFHGIKGADAFTVALGEHMTGKAKGHFGKLEGFVTGLYICGAAPSSADFHLWEMLDQHVLMSGSKDFLSEFPKLEALYTAMAADPALASYFESDMYKTWGVNNPMAANWTGPLGAEHDFA